MPASAGVWKLSGQAFQPSASRPPVRLRSYLLSFGLLTAFLILAHGPLLRLPYYWDEIGQFIPASLDLFRAGAWIPVSTVPNVHPPGLMAYLSTVWSLFGYSVLATRIAMLLVAAAAALVTFLLAIELTRGTAGTPAFAALALLCISPLFFAQSMLAQLDMPAMCLTLLALLLFLQNQLRASAVVCALLVLVKETGAIVPLVLGAWAALESRDRNFRLQSLWFLLPFPGLVLWLIALHHATGYWLGNPQFATYNVAETLHLTTFVLALARRSYYLFIGSGHIIGTIVLIWAWNRMPVLRSRPWRIAGALLIAHAVLVSALGGAVLERYLLPVLPILYIAFAASMRALPPRMRAIALAALLICLGAANFLNPLYPFPFENNLAFANFVAIEQEAALAVEDRSDALPGGGRIASVFPVTDGLRNPDFGFVKKPRRVESLYDFSRAEIQRMRSQDPDMVLVFERTWDPLHLLRYPPIENFLERHYGYTPELTSEEIAAALSMRFSKRWTRAGMKMELLERYRAPF